MTNFKSFLQKLFPFSFFIIISVSAFSQNIDIDLLKTINVNRSVKLDPFFRACTNSTYPISITIPVAILGTGFIKNDSALKNQGIQIGVALAITTVVTEGLKIIIQRPRPFITYPFIQQAAEGSGASFPSGHVSIAFTTATSLSLIYHKWYIVVPSFVWASAIAYSRMDLGVHYPSDVLAGAVIGVGSSLLSYKANKWLHRHYKLRL